MLSIISSILTAILNKDKIEETEYGVLNDPSYLTQMIGSTFILELLAGLILIIRKVVKRH